MVCFPYCLLHFDTAQPYEAVVTALAVGALKFSIVQKPLQRNCLSSLPLGADNRSSSCLQFLWCRVAGPTDLFVTGCVSLQAGGKTFFHRSLLCMCLVPWSSVDRVPWGQSGGQGHAGDLVALASCRFPQRHL